MTGGARMKQTTTTEIGPEQYAKDFAGKEREALRQALDTRKFEIDLYWRRAAYFWTFIAASFAGFFAVQASSSPNKQDLSVVLSCLGIVFSFGWFCVNRGSKYWQENWEKHVDMLEDHVVGPLYKTVLSRNHTKKMAERLVDLITGPSRLSVSKINQIISLYVFLLWICLLFYSLPPFDRSQQINLFYALVIVLTVLACGSFLWLGRTYTGGFFHVALQRKSRLKSGELS